MLTNTHTAIKKVSLFSCSEQIKEVCVLNIQSTRYKAHPDILNTCHLSPLGRSFSAPAHKKNSMKNELRLGQMKVTGLGVCLCVRMGLCVCVCVFGCECFPLSRMYGRPVTFTAVIDCWSPSVNTKKLHNHTTLGPQPRWDQTLPSSFVNLSSQTSPMFSDRCLLPVDVWGWNFPSSVASRCTTPNVQTKDMADRDKLMFLWQVYTHLKPQQCSLKTTVKIQSTR